MGCVVFRVWVLLFSCFVCVSVQAAEEGLFTECIESHTVNRRHRITFKPEEDEQLKKVIEQYGTHDWQNVADHMPGRNPRQCRERWKHYLSAPEGSKREWTQEEDDLLIRKVQEMGGKWTKFTHFFEGRSDLHIKLRYRKLAPHLKSCRSTRHSPIRLVVIEYQPVPLEAVKPLQTPAKKPKREAKLSSLPVVSTGGSQAEVSAEDSQSEVQYGDSEDYTAEDCKSWLNLPEYDNDDSWM